MNDVLFFASFAEFLSVLGGYAFHLRREKSLTAKDAKKPRKGRKENRRSYLRLAPSSAMYMISCLKINRLGWSSRVNLTMFLS